MTITKHKLSIRALALACGSVGALTLLVLGVVSLFGYGHSAVEVLSNLLIGFDVSAAGMVVGIVWGFWLGFVWGALVAWIYNKML